MRGSFVNLGERWTEWRAGRISDPIERLRFLRRRVTRAPRRLHIPVVVLVTLCAMLASARSAFAPGVYPGNVGARALKADSLPEVWLVEFRPDRESYSNGLQVDLPFAVRNRERPMRPAGIVYHTTESQLAELNPAANQRLRVLGRGLLHYVREEKAYHYLIDRFGRVFRVVAEEDVAFHAGHSVWADEQHTYVDLNSRFLAVAIESQTRTGDEPAAITAAQIHSTRILTEMLRSRYRIAGENCVTHAQVSVNPRNFRVGWHTDWAGSFPFEALGLPNNYLRPVAAVEKFGFGYDPAFFAATGVQMWQGIVAAEDRLRARAASLGVSVAALKATLRNQYQVQSKEEISQ